MLDRSPRQTEFFICAPDQSLRATKPESVDSLGPHLPRAVQYADENAFEAHRDSCPNPDESRRAEYVLRFALALWKYASQKPRRLFQ